MYDLAIIGCNSVLGKATACLMADSGFKVIALGRHPEKNSELKNKGVDFIKGDIRDAAAIRQGCSDSFAILTCVHGMMGRGKQSSEIIDHRAHCQLIDIAKEAGVQQFIYTSVAGASPLHPIDFFRTKYKVEQYLTNSGLTYIILRPGAFMEWHMHNLLGKGMMTRKKALLFGKGENPNNFIAVNDIAQIVQLVFRNEKFYNQVVPLAGPENLTKNEVAHLYASELHISPRIKHIPRGLLSFLSMAFKPFHPGISRIMKAAIFSDTQDCTMPASESIARFGLRPTTAEQFVKQAIKAN